MNAPILSLNDIGYRYEDTGFALEGVSLDLYRGERVAVLGGNGAGKSTFFLLCGGVLTPDRGELILGGVPVSPGKKGDLLRLRQGVGIVFQDPNQQILGPTVECEISFGPMNLRLPRPEVKARTQRAMEDMELTRYSQTPPHYLSGGEKKRLTIADILAMRSDIMLLDEPTACLDCAGGTRLEELLDQLTSQGKTLVISTHDIDFAWRWADRVLLFSRGRLIADRAPLALFSDTALLEQEGLRRPYLYEMSRYLHEKMIWPESRWARVTEDMTFI
ncbi:Cobalt import ATP-binding protein CbiO [bioreactor metagenome]|uniref:Cobalt import ATP-binding protein CbiO n=1 Tax=bioreactor metagenome TaxID=1076179 RepID=A0A644YE07_9ZZZZ